MGNQFIMPGRVFYGENALANASDVIASLGKKALVVTDPMMMKLGTAKMVTDVLDEKGIHYAIYSNITGEPTDKMIEAGLDVYNDQDCDFLIAVGGGSPIDSMKAIAAVSTSGGSIDDYLGKVITVPTPPMVAIPTTSGTGSEATQFTIITNTEKDIKMLLKGAVLMPDIAIDDPAFTLTAPKSVTAATGLDALTHAMEGYITKAHWEMTDMFHLKAMKIIYENLEKAVNKNQKAIEQMALAQYVAGMGFSNVGLGIVHSMAHQLGALYDTPHGVANALLLPYVMEWNGKVCPDRFRDMGEAFGLDMQGLNDEQVVKKVVEAIRNLAIRLNIPQHISEVGGKEKDIPLLAQKALEDPCTGGNPRNVSLEDLKDLFSIAF